MKKLEGAVSLQDFLSATKANHEPSRLAPLPSQLTPEQREAAVADVKIRLTKLVGQLIDLANAGDRATQQLLLDFGTAGAYLLATAPENPGEPCPDCGKIH
ncbi:MAG TPA: hypothetical protein VM577_05355 [Anaerovoracaceae bacterium]|nr:hypothetical protein [Anaerovoracaceae bacterium]